MLEKVPRGLFPGSKKRKQPAELSVDVLPVAKLPETDEEPTALPEAPPTKKAPAFGKFQSALDIINSLPDNKKENPLAATKSIQPNPE